MLIRAEFFFFYQLQKFTGYNNTLLHYNIINESFLLLINIIILCVNYNYIIIPVMNILNLLVSTTVSFVPLTWRHACDSFVIYVSEVSC